METRIFMAHLSNNETNVFYAMPEITEEQITKFVAKVTKLKVDDIYEEKQSNLQYYCIDGRVWIDTPEKAKKLLETIKNQ